MVVQNIYCEEQEDIDQPAADRNFVRFEEMRRTIPVELWDVSGRCHEQELDESQEGSLKDE